MSVSVDTAEDTVDEAESDVRPIRLFHGLCFLEQFLYVVLHLVSNIPEAVEKLRRDAACNSALVGVSNEVNLKICNMRNEN